MTDVYRSALHFASVISTFKFDKHFYSVYCFAEVLHAALIPEPRDVFNGRVLAWVEAIGHAVLHRLNLQLRVMLPAFLHTHRGFLS